MLQVAAACAFGLGSSQIIKNLLSEQEIGEKVKQVLDIK